MEMFVSIIIRILGRTLDIERGFVIEFCYLNNSLIHKVSIKINVKEL